MSAAAGASWLEAAGASPYGVALALLSVGLVYVLLEQLQFRWTCKQLPSPPGFFTPLIGGVVDMVCDPYGYWERQRLLAPAGISKFFLLGKTVFFSTDTETSRHILMNNGPDSLMMVRSTRGTARRGAGRPRARTGGDGVLRASRWHHAPASPRSGVPRPRPQHRAL